jgi:hypothetical protein
LRSLTLGSWVLIPLESRISVCVKACASGKQSSYYFHAGIFLGIFFDPEDGGNMFL